MLPAPRPCGGAAAPAGWLSPGGITKSAPVPRFRRPKHSSFCRVIVAARARSTSLQLPILDCRLYFTGQHRKNQYFFAGPHNFFAAACAAVSASSRERSAPPSAFLSLRPPSRTRRGRRPRRPASCSFAKGIFRAPARHPFAHGGKRMQKRRQKPMVFGIPFVRLQLRCKKVPQRIASASTLAAADMARREQWSPPRLGDYQIAHLPPAAASVGAARWPRPEARNIPYENKSAGRCGRRVRAQRLPVRKKKKDRRSGLSFLVQN